MKIPYWKYLQSDHWQSVRRQTLAKYPTCEICGVKNPKEVNHLTYKNLWNEHEDDLMAVCRSCHAGWHDRWGEVIGMGGNALVARVAYYVFQWRVLNGCIQAHIDGVIHQAKFVEMPVTTPPERPDA